MEEFDELYREIAKATTERERKARREELAKDLLLKIVETTPGTDPLHIGDNVRAAVEYTDALLAELERTE